MLTEMTFPPDLIIRVENQSLALVDMIRSGGNDVAYVEVVNRTLACRDQTGRRPLSQRYSAFPDLSVNAVAIRRLRDMSGLPSTCLMSSG